MNFRKEKKYPVTINEFYGLEDYLVRKGMKKLFEPRTITSIYFDTADFRMFHDSEEGVLPRKKIRIRWYGNDDGKSFETKISSIEGRLKLTSRLEGYLLKNYPGKTYMDAMYGAVEPVLRVQYNRSYYQLSEMRLTFDTNISYQRLNHAIQGRFFDPNFVIEIKASADCPDDFISNVIPFSTGRFSKYARGLLFSLGELSEV